MTAKKNSLLVMTVDAPACLFVSTWEGEREREKERERETIFESFCFEDDGFRLWTNLPTVPLSMHI